MHARVCLLFLGLLAAAFAAAGDRPGTGDDPVETGALPPVQVLPGRPQWETRSDLDAAQRSAARRLPDALQELAAAALDGSADAANPARFRLVDGSTYGELFQVQRDKVVVDLTVVADVGRAMNGLAGISGVEILASAPAPAFHVVSALVPVQRALRQRAALADWLLGQGKARHVVFAPPPPLHRFPLLPEPLRRVMGDDARRHDAALARWAATRADVSHTAIDLELGPEHMAGDGFHPGAPVYGACGEAIAAHINRLADGVTRMRAR